MKWGDFYSSEYVNRLYRMISRNTKEPFALYCLTDDPKGVDPAVQIRPCPFYEKIPFGGWRKVALWAKDLYDLKGEFLYLDLDIMITGPMDEFFHYKGNSDYMVMRNYTTMDRRIGNTSVFRFTIGTHPDVLAKLLEDPRGAYYRYKNSQTFISNTISTMDFWPDGWIRQFKVHCMRPWPLRLFMQPKFYPDAKIIVCTGHPAPDELVKGKWEAPWYKKIYKTIPPVKWAQEVWK